MIIYATPDLQVSLSKLVETILSISSRPLSQNPRMVDLSTKALVKIPISITILLRSLHHQKRLWKINSLTFFPFISGLQKLRKISL